MVAILSLDPPSWIIEKTTDLMNNDMSRKVFPGKSQSSKYGGLDLRFNFLKSAWELCLPPGLNTVAIFRSKLI